MRWTRSLCLFTPLLTLVFSGESPAQPRSAESTRNAPLTASRMIEVFDLILEHHVASPTLQQMVHRSVISRYVSSQLEPPSGLAQEISEARGRDELQLIVERAIEITEPHASGSHEFEAWLNSILNDDQVRIVPAKQQRVNDQFAANRYVGIGITLMGPPNDFPEMFKVMPTGPADQVGAKRGDKIIEVDGHNTKGVSLGQVIDWLRGAEGSDVDLVLRRDDVDRSVTMTRGVVPLPTVDPPIFSKSGETVGIRFLRLSASNVHELRRIHASLDPKVKHVVFDLRVRSRASDIGTNHLHYGSLLASALIDDAPLGLVADRNGKRRMVNAESGVVFAQKNLVAIVDESTSGVFKWLAAAIQDTSQGSLYGAASLAPAMTSDVVALRDGSYCVAMPTGRLYRASGKPLNGRLLATASWPIRHATANVPGDPNMALGGRSTREMPESTLHPHFAFPDKQREAMTSQGWQVIPGRTLVRDLKPLLEFIEENETKKDAAQGE